MIPALVGALLALGAMLALFRAGVLAERSGMAVMLAAVALFFPVFAAQEGNLGEVIVHGAVFLVFCAFAMAGFRGGTRIIAAGLIAHGIFDLGMLAIGAPGPAWWPIFCAAFDVVAGGILLRLLYTRKIPA